MPRIAIPCGYRELDGQEKIGIGDYICPKDKTEFKHFKKSSKAIGMRYLESKQKKVLFSESVVITNRIRLNPISIKGKIRINLNKIT